jgi:site-specific DNA-methyltransferase (adenine-specific)
MKKETYTLEATDCIKGMRRLRPGTVDVVVTSPPYNLGIHYGRYQDDKTESEYLDWCCQWVREVKRVLKAKGSFFLNVAGSPAQPLLPHRLALALTDQAGFVLQNTFHWIKSISLETRKGERLTAGHFKPINSKKFVTDCHEYVFHFTHQGDVALDRLALGVPYADKSNISRWGHTGGKDLRCRGNAWFIPYETILSRKRDRPHPATFPVGLASFCLKIHGAGPEATVLDPFLGIGHSALAARQCGIRHFIGFDIDAGYLKAAHQSLEALGARP